MVVRIRRGIASGKATVASTPAFGIYKSNSSQLYQQQEEVGIPPVASQEDVLRLCLPDPRNSTLRCHAKNEQDGTPRQRLLTPEEWVFTIAIRRISS